jgi:hypothetical protein
MFSMKKVNSDNLATNTNIKIDKEAKSKKLQKEQEKKLFHIFGSNVKPYEQESIGDKKVFKVFKKCYKVLLSLGLVYTLNSQYQMDNLISLASLFAILLFLFSLNILSFIGIFKTFSFKLDKSLRFGAPIAMALMLLGSFPTQSDMTTDVLSNSFSTTSSHTTDIKVIELLKENSKLYPQNTSINEKIIEDINSHHISSFSLIHKNYGFFNYHYELSKNYQDYYKSFRKDK